MSDIFFKNFLDYMCVCLCVRIAMSYTYTHVRVEREREEENGEKKFYDIITIEKCMIGII